MSRLDVKVFEVPCSVGLSTVGAHCLCIWGCKGAVTIKVCFAFMLTSTP